MGWGLLLYLLVGLPLLVTVAPGWAWLILLVWLVMWLRRRNGDSPPKSAPKPTHKGLLSESGVHDLLLLRLELNRLLAAGTLSGERHAQLTQKIDQLWAFHLSRFGVNAGNPVWNERRDVAWAVLNEFSGLPLGSAPWYPPADALPMAAPLPTNPPPKRPAQQRQAKDAAVSGQRGWRTHRAYAQIARRPPSLQRPPTPSPPPLPAAITPTPPRPAAPPPAPSALETALQAVSGWSIWLVPFLVQNIGWLVGGICFVAGSVFLVAYTGGFAKAFTVFAVLLAYSGLLLWGAYQLRRRRPELRLSSAVLLSLALALVPLTFAAALRMVLAADSIGATGFALLLTAAYGYAAYWAVMLASSLQERALQGRHPAVFLTLTGCQAAVLLLKLAPTWPLLAICHLGLLGLLGHALLHFTPDWLRSVFVDRRRLAYYAAGSLVYAAVVSFAHLTAGGATIALPAGYAGPFLLVLVGLLFQVDAEFKHWSGRHPYLSHFSFVLYGLSVVALALVIGSFGATLITLLLALGVYATVIWRYLSWAPLALWLACAYWLYGLLLLAPCPPSWHLLLSLPGLGLLGAVTRRYLARRAAHLATAVYISVGLSLAWLLAWSLSHSVPGGLACLSVLAVLGLVLALPKMQRFLAVRWTDDSRPLPPSIYASACLSSLALAYAPPLLPVPWALQTAVGGLLLVCGWTGLAQRRRGQVAAWLNSALLGIVAVLLLGESAASAAAPWVWIGVLTGSGAVLLWQSVAFYLRGLAYLALLAFGAAGGFGKLAYSTHTGNGGLLFLLALALCLTAAGLRLATARRAALRREWQPPRPPLTALGLFHADADCFSLGELLAPPLRHAAAVSWLLGLGLWLWRWAQADTGAAWALSGGGAAISAVMLAGALHWRHWPCVPMLLVWASASAFLDADLFALASIVYAGSLWRGSVALCAGARHPRWAAAAQLDFSLETAEQRAQLEQNVHRSGMALSLFGLVVLLHAPLHVNPHWLAVGLLAALLFFHAAGWRYRSRWHSYLVLALALIAAALRTALDWAATDWQFAQIGATAALALAGGAWACYGLAAALALRLPDAQHSFAASLYRKPLHAVGLLLAWLALVLTLLRIVSNAASADGWTFASMALALPVLGALNRRLQCPGLATTVLTLALLTAWWALLWRWQGGGAAALPWQTATGDAWPALAGLLCASIALHRWRGGPVPLATVFYGYASLLGLHLLLALLGALLPVGFGVDAATASNGHGRDISSALLLGLALAFTPHYPRHWLRLNAQIAAGIAVLLWLYTDWLASLLLPSLCWVLIGWALLALSLRGGAAGNSLKHWASASLIAAVVLLPVGLAHALPQSLCSLLLAAGLCAALAHRQQSRAWLHASLGMAAIGLHGWPWLWLPAHSGAALLLPSLYSLQTALLLWLWPRLCGAEQPLADGWRGDVRGCLRNLRGPLLGLFLLHALLHGLVYLNSLTTAIALPPASHAAAGLAGAWVLMLELRRLHGAYASARLYPLLLGAFALLAYLRLLVFGLAAPGLADTAALVLLTFGLALLHRLSAAPPLRHAANSLPVLILCSVQWQLASAATSANLLAVGGLYLWLGHAQSQRLPLYCSLLLCNIAAYVWVPHWAQQAGLLQLYLIPATASVLLMLHLHRHELPPDTLNTTRLAATSLLYASASLDVFLRPSFGVFLLALGLSLGGILVGISLRIRAFVYSGISFLLLNLTAQLSQLYPEGRLARALVLMGLGSLITIAMILFSLKREAILKRLRILRADLAAWE